jgi:hypothetical protein
MISQSKEQVLVRMQSYGPGFVRGHTFGELRVELLDEAHRTPARP